jgi:hypothetical protein
MADVAPGLPQPTSPWNFRVIELPGRLVIRRVDYAVGGIVPLYFSKAEPQFSCAPDDSDHFVRLLNAIAEALTKPSLVEEDFKGLIS